MGSSGLIYAAIVAAWAAVLVPRWVRRNEEVDQAREADLARGVRVLGPADSLTPSARTQARHASLAVDTAEPAVVTVNERGVEPSTDYGRAARRRRRVLAVLVIALVGVTVAAVVGRIPLWSVAAPLWCSASLSGWPAGPPLPRRTAGPTADGSSRPGQRSSPRRGSQRSMSRRRRSRPPGRVGAGSGAVADVPDQAQGTSTGDPEHRSLPSRRMDVRRLEPTESIPLPRPIAIPEAVGENVDDLPEHRPAVGD